MAPRIAQQIGEPTTRFIVARCDDTQQVLSVAQWSTPDTSSTPYTHSSAEETQERQTFEDEILVKSLPETCNKRLVLEFTRGLRNLRERVLDGCVHFLLENLATQPQYRGRGLAGRLVEWVFPLADEKNVLVYLDTASDNGSAMRLYEKLGFQERGRNTIKDLSRFVGKREWEESGAGTEHTHVALVRYPTCALE
jgi:ribosomal protein S18 acetylase RimI-like enzyme